jgi:hypothetical protein
MRKIAHNPTNSPIWFDSCKAERWKNDHKEETFEQSSATWKHDQQQDEMRCVELYTDFGAPPLILRCLREFNLPSLLFFSTGCGVGIFPFSHALKHASS